MFNLKIRVKKRAKMNFQFENSISKKQAKKVGGVGGVFYNTCVFYPCF